MTLAGQMRLVPGAVRGPAIFSSRPDLVGRLTVGLPAAQLPQRLGAVFALCAHAHRWTAQRAVDAALGSACAASAADRQAHRLATLREHVLRLGHDWPRLLPGVRPADQAALSPSTCPAWREDLPAVDRLAATTAWLETAWLGCTPEAWLQANDRDPEAWPLHWAAASDTPLARLLHAQRDARQLQAPGLPLRLLDDPGRTMPDLARDMADRPGFCLRPDWRGNVPDTGPWQRQSDPARHPAAATAWDRLVARLAEALRLAGPAGDDLLGHGALTLASGEGLAWTEMARGLLVHLVRVDAPPGAQPVVSLCRVLAPTEWNFHPEGVLARALRALPGSDVPGEVRDAATRLAVAFDPCVPFVIEGDGGMSEDGRMTPQESPCTN